MIMKPKMDRHECGTCGEEFSQIEEFVTHKKSGCQESEYSPPNVDTLGSKRNTTEGSDKPEENNI